MRASTTVPASRISRGYGAALDADVKAARGPYVLIADADDRTTSLTLPASSPICEMERTCDGESLSREESSRAR
jgi:glycosyltransferase involved in cell wall biosynthesis